MPLEIPRRHSESADMAHILAPPIADDRQREVVVASEPNEKISDLKQIEHPAVRV